MAVLPRTARSHPSRVISACHPAPVTDTLRPTHITGCVGQGPDSSGEGKQVSGGVDVELGFTGKKPAYAERHRRGRRVELDALAGLWQ